MAMRGDLFSPIVSEDRLHPQFTALVGSPVHTEARALMQMLAARMDDPNGHFVRDFQSDGFHARLFELACFAYLQEAGLTIDRSHARPDFIATTGEQAVAVEAVTANPVGGQGEDISLRNMKKLTDEEVFEKVSVGVAERISRSLRKKLRHRYHELPHCAGKPLALIIAPFFEAGASFYTDDALFYPLYGGPEGWSNTVAPFFQQQEAATISAVLYCNQFTVSRFFRLAMDFRAENAPRTIREGVCYRKHGADDHHPPQQFVHLLGSEGLERETWFEGVTVFENPFALTPLPRGVLPGTSYVSVQDGYVCREVTAFHPVVSFTRINVPTSAI